MPDYYKNFSCKIGGCRSACCEGWRISVSMNNYFHLVGLNCKKELRSRLDVGLRVLDRPSVDEYACFEPRYDGNCPMRLADAGAHFTPSSARMFCPTSADCIREEYTEAKTGSNARWRTAVRVCSNSFSKEKRRSNFRSSKCR